MLRRMKIGTRVNLLIAAPLLALVALMLVSFLALQRASVRGQEYKDLKAVEELRSSIVPPPGNLLTAWASVNQLATVISAQETSATQGEIDRAIDALSDARTDWEASIAYWRTQPLETDAREAFEGGATAGESFFGYVDALLLPAVEQRNADAVVSVVRDLGHTYRVEQAFVERSLVLVEARVADREAAADDFVERLLLFISAAVAIVMLVMLVIAFFVRRSIVKPIVALSNRARQVAEADLPDAVHEIQSQDADAPLPVIEPFVTATHDELADLSASFNSVQSVALDLAAEQALARRNVADNLVNIARRTQTLLGRSLSSLSELEQTERDPAMLQNLFKLDHLSTRMRRNAQSLLVLAGAEQNRLWSPPVPIGDVVRAAVSEIESYERVDLGDLAVASVHGALAPEIAHLLAELLENATSFSPPSSRVMVVGRSFVDGHQLAIIDYGIGMSQEQIDEANATLRRRADFDKSTSKMLGLQVAARLASRHGIQITLAPTAGATGVTAIVKLPLGVLEIGVPAANGAPASTGPSLPPPGRAQQPRSMPAPVGVANTATAAPPLPTVTPTGAQPLTVAAPSAPAPLTVSGSSPTSSANDQSWADLDSDDLWSLVEPPASEPNAATSVNGLTKRVRGAQMPDLGTPEDDFTDWNRPAEHVRSSLDSFQRGTDAARQAPTDDHAG